MLKGFASTSAIMKDKHYTHISPIPLLPLSEGGGGVVKRVFSGAYLSF
jgi:hypothetical protein